MADEESELDEEEIILRINPKTLDYKTKLTYCDVEDLYIVLRDLIYRLETAEIHSMIPMEDENGKPVGEDAFRERIQELKRVIDERTGVTEAVEYDGRSTLN
jgi:hypothetical protein